MFHGLYKPGIISYANVCEWERQSKHFLYNIYDPAFKMAAVSPGGIRNYTWQRCHGNEL